MTDSPKAGPLFPPAEPWPRSLGEQCPQYWGRIERRCQLTQGHEPPCYFCVPSYAIRTDISIDRSRVEPTADCPDCMKCLEQEERATAYADQLTAMIGVLVGQDMGEHSSENEPWENGIEALRVAIGSKQSQVEPTAPRESDWNCVHCGRDNDPSETHCVQCEWSRKHTINGVLHERRCFDHPCICGAKASGSSVEPVG